MTSAIPNQNVVLGKSVNTSGVNMVVAQTAQKLELLNHAVTLDTVISRHSMNVLTFAQAAIILTKFSGHPSKPVDHNLCPSKLYC